MKFDIKNKGERAQIQLLGDIVSSGMKFDEIDKGFDDVLNALNDINGKPLDVVINSGGGSVYEGLAIHNLLKNYSKKNEVNVQIQGLAGSIASIIALSGSNVSIPKNAFFMIHKPWCMTGGNADELLETIEHLDRVESMMLDIYKENLRNADDFEKVKEMVQNETWLTGEEASQLFNMNLIEEKKMVASVGNVFNHYQNVPDDLKLFETEQALQEDETAQKKKELQELLKELETETEKIREELKNLDVEKDESDVEKEKEKADEEKKSDNESEEKENTDSEKETKEKNLDDEPEEKKEEVDEEKKSGDESEEKEKENEKEKKQQELLMLIDFL